LRAFFSKSAQTMVAPAAERASAIARPLPELEPICVRTNGYYRDPSAFPIFSSKATLAWAYGKILPKRKQRSRGFAFFSVKLAIPGAE
jgi:hypothetical protein